MPSHIENRLPSEYRIFPLLQSFCPRRRNFLSTLTANTPLICLVVIFHHFYSSYTSRFPFSCLLFLLGFLFVPFFFFSLLSPCLGFQIDSCLSSSVQINCAAQVTSTAHDIRTFIALTQQHHHGHTQNGWKQ